MRTHWYGWQTLLTDAAAVLGVYVSPDLTLGLYLAGGPVVHWVHGNAGRGFASLGLRVGAPVVLTYALVSTCDSDAEYGCLGEAILGVTAGVVIAVVVDATVLARERVPAKEPTELALGPVKVTPTFAVTDKQTTLGLVGVF